MRRRSNREIGAESLRKLAAYLDSTEQIPQRNGIASISGIALAAGVDRQALYRDAARVLIVDALAKRALSSPDQQHVATGSLERATLRINELEQQLTVAKVELSDLRKRLRFYASLEQHMIETGVLPR